MPRPFWLQDGSLEMVMVMLAEEEEEEEDWGMARVDLVARRVARRRRKGVVGAWRYIIRGGVERVVNGGGFET